MFDIFDEQTAQFEHYTRVEEISSRMGTPVVDVLHRGPLRFAELVEVAEQAVEGVVIRIEFPAGGIERYKYVRQGFKKNDRIST